MSEYCDRGSGRLLPGSLGFYSRFRRPLKLTIVDGDCPLTKRPVLDVRVTSRLDMVFKKTE